MLNGITVICEGKTRHLELDKGQADRFFWYAGMASEADSVASRELTQQEIGDRGRRAEIVTDQAITIKGYLAMMAKLDERQLAHILAFIDLLEYGDSWMREIICDLLRDVEFSGPAKALERNPRDVLADIAYDLFDWWDNIDTARSHAAQHPSLFPPPTTTPEPPAVQDVAQPIRKRTAGHPRARKPRKVATRG